MKKPLLTAIIFTFNHKDFIERCIKSHLNQKTSYDYEIRIYDDCSTDGTSEICREYARLYPNKLKLTVQKENTFLKEYLQLQSYQAISEIDSKYFSICDGDDYWCDENKIQIALDFLENHSEYHGFAHDTYYEDIYTKNRRSYIHDELNLACIQNPVTLDAQAPFLLVSSRIFRTTDYAKLRILPIDYLSYYYHLSKGPLYYYDKPMAVYSLGINNTYAGLPTKFILDNSAMMTYRLSKLFNFTQDDFCTQLLLIYDTKHKVGEKRYHLLCILKSLLGRKLGWQVWFILNFTLRYGFEVRNINYIYDRKKVKEALSPENKRKLSQAKIENVKETIKRDIRHIKYIKLILVFEKILPKKFSIKLKQAAERKRKRLPEFNKQRHAMTEYFRE